ncbi:MAG: hypothetical protein WC136_11935 [Sphaerochaeta sp.]|jgi:hypothetical protein
MNDIKFGMICNWVDAIEDNIENILNNIDDMSKDEILQVIRKQYNLIDILYKIEKNDTFIQGIRRTKLGESSE